ncbi:MAG: BMP family ABC transporter substrate-binding protein [Jatrophihabitantaceae bacterium]
MTALSRGRILGLSLACVSALTIAACASSTTSGGTSNNSSPQAPPTANSSAGAGTLLPGEPDVNGDGKVVIGVLSPGDINDHGYYESFVDEADTFAKSKGWTVIKQGNVATTNALAAARALCQQGVDMVALGASELSDAIPAASEPVCAKTAWYVPASGNIAISPRIMLSSDIASQSVFVGGYAAGLLMKAKGDTKAGFIAGQAADYSKAASAAFLAGIREVIPTATVVDTFTGDNNDSAKAKEAMQAQISQGVKAVYPYLGGATDAVAALANSNNVLTLTPGTDRCDSTSPKFDVSVLFSPGDYFAAALQDFAAGKLRMGIARVWKMGIDPFPSVKICNPVGSDDSMLKSFIADIGSGKIDVTTEVTKLGS